MMTMTYYDVRAGMVWINPSRVFIKAFCIEGSRIILLHPDA
jgi:hypothetical protein